MRKNIPPDETNFVVDFSRKPPRSRLTSIRNGYNVCSWCALSFNLLIIRPKLLDYGQSEYIHQFGMKVSNEPLRVQARVIKAPVLRYHQSSKQPKAVRAIPFSVQEVTI
jgi:eukaryotic translation initiation factor 2C